MDADDHPVETILADARRFMVPLYQRKYQWADNRLEPFWDDVEAKAAEVLEGESRFQHYMGALILAPIGEGSKIGVTPRVQVVDGQQRLTTFQLLLAAIREVARKHKCEDIIAYVQDYLFNPLKSKDTDPLTRFKLTPTPADQEVFHYILDNEYKQVKAKYISYYWGKSVPKNTPLRALRAYEVFLQKVDRFCRIGPLENIVERDEESETDGETLVEERLEAILKAVLNRLKLVVITLGEDDDAQVIFETLNSKGEPLLAMDLVRNNIFYRAEKEGVSAETLYKELWDPFDHTWWRDPAPNARPRRPRIDHFLSHVLAAESGEKISMRELYAEYRSFAVPKGKPRFTNVEDELKLLQVHSPTYETLEGRIDSDDPIGWLGRKLATWQVTTAYPIALQIAKSEIEDHEKKALAELIYSYIVRRALCGLTAKNLNKMFQGVSQIFLKQGPCVEALTSFFLGREGDSSRFPSNAELRQGIINQPIYNQLGAPKLRDILWELETGSRSGFSEEIGMPVNLQIEHVLPSTWTKSWPFEEGDWVGPLDDDPRTARRRREINTLGNLTLITAKLNVSSGNKSFEAKQKKYSKHTGLFLNRWFLGQVEWNETKINERAEELASMSIDIWTALPT